MTSPAPGWYPDQASPQLLRWWDGNSWTQHTQPNQQAPQPGYQQPAYQQQQAHQQPQQQAYPQQGGYAAAGAAGFAGQQQPQQQMAPGMPQAGAWGGGQPGAGPLYTEPVLLIAQKQKVFGVSTSAGAYQIFDGNRQQIGTFREPETLASKALDAINPLADFKTKDFQLTDANGAVVLKVDLPQGLKASFKPKFQVMSGAGAPIGTIERRKVMDLKLAFHFTANGADVGTFQQERGGGFAKRFVCRDMQGNPLAEFTKRSAGQVSFKEVFTQDDSYVLQRPHPLPEPMGSLVLIAACALDTVFFEKE